MDRINKALSSGANNEELMLINRLSVGGELTKALKPLVKAKFREALEGRAWESAVKEALPTAIGNFLRGVDYGGWAREQVKASREFNAFMREFGRLLRGGANALIGGRVFSEVFPRVASIARGDLLVDSVVRLHLAVTAREEVVKRLSVGGRGSVVNLIDYADSVHRQPLAALLELLGELGIDLGRAIEWQGYSEQYGRLGIRPSELKALIRALRALIEDGFIKYGDVEGVARDLAIKASAAKPNSDVFREFHRDLWGFVLGGSESARNVGPGELISVGSIDEGKLGILLSRYMPPELVIDILDQVRHYAIDEAEALLSRLRDSLSSEVDSLRGGELRGGLEAKLSDLVSNGGLGDVGELSREVDGGVRRRLVLHEAALNAVNNALNALSYNENPELRIQLLRASVNALRDSLGKIINGFRDAEIGIGASNLIEAVIISESLINGLSRYRQPK